MVRVQGITRMWRYSRSTTFPECRPVFGFGVHLPGRTPAKYGSKMRSDSEAGSYLRRIDFVYHSTLGLRVIKKKIR